jgi:hypothetical protein
MSKTGKLKRERTPMVAGSSNLEKAGVDLCEVTRTREKERETNEWKIAFSRLKDCTDTLRIVGESFGFRTEDGDLGKFHEQAMAWADTCTEDKVHWISFMKFKLASFFAFWANQEQPPAPGPKIKLYNPQVLIGGRLGRFFIAKLREAIRNDDIEGRYMILAAIKQSKRGMVRPDKEDLNTSAIKTQIHLTTAKEQKPVRSLPGLTEDDLWFSDEPTLSIDEKLDQTSYQNYEMAFTRVADWVFKNKLTEEECMKAFFPSTSANYVNNRENMGAVGSILDSDVLDGLRTPGGVKVYETRTERLDYTDEEESPSIGIEPEDSELNARFKILWKRIMEKAFKEENIAVVVPLAEPLKVRNITKEPPFTQTVITGTMKALFTRMTKKWQFLINRPLSLDELHNRFGRVTTGFISGDYSDATNKLHSWASKLMLRCVARAVGMPQEVEFMIRKALVEHHVMTNEMFKEYQKSDKMDKEQLLKKVKQATGQLMGSRASFVILCLINFAVNLMAHEFSTGERILFLDHFDIIVNGDDFLKPSAGERNEAIWQRVAGGVGLEKSVGKSYESDEFIEMNSTLFTIRWYEVPDTNLKRNDPGYIDDRQPWEKYMICFTHIKYINLGLLMGISRSQAVDVVDTLDDPYNNIGARYQRLMDGCPYPQHIFVHKEFLKYHDEQLKRTTLPYYIPTWLGGLGLIGGPGQPSELDLRMAKYILLNWNQKAPLAPKADTNWFIYKRAIRRLPKPEYTTWAGDHGVQKYKQIVGLQCLSLLFDSNISKKDLFKSEKMREAELKRKKVKTHTHESALNYLRHNESLWKPPRGALPEPLELRFLHSEKQYETYGRKVSRVSLKNKARLIDYALD